MAIISTQKSCTEGGGGGGGGGVVDFDAPCGPLSSAFMIVGVANTRAPTRHRLAMIAFSFLILSLLVLNYRDEAAAGFTGQSLARTLLQRGSLRTFHNLD